MTTSVKNNFFPPSLMSNLQQVLINRSDVDVDAAGVEQTSAKDNDPIQVVASATSSAERSTVHGNVCEDSEKEILLVTNGEGIDSPGLTSLLEALVRDSRFNVHVCAPQSDRSVSGHSVTVRETLAACSVDINGVTAAYEVSGTPADCVSLALSGSLFSWSKPVLVISGINRGSSCGHNMFYSGAVAAAREALICGVPALCLSLNWKNGVSSENDLKDAASVCLPLLYAAIRDVRKEKFPKSCLLNVEIPTCPIANKGFKVTRQSLWRSSLSWQAVPANKHPSAGHFLSNQQSLGMKLAQLSRDASAAGAARRLNSRRKNVEIESVGVAGKVNSPQTVKKYFRLEFSEKEEENVEEDLDFTAVENGFVSVTPFSLSIQPDIQGLVTNWIAAALASEQ
ncbi:hypothetical protein P3X46_007613 [Hevea brasiliensis]|uniref:Survival protein SurE-like phosphatase/nucleotidase domain-containing protein n=1 Tax=Hevea brasiliensis TaxID=3981 RepID=A0ABQ9MUL7_HEVBR|nr:uncharacterized protein LOC110642412 [Hevea brasiliensis]KAJ9183806.1 hypothetical protein P3X46_007613 [Hevea brasiliensis]